MKQFIILLSFMGLVAFSSLSAQTNEGVQTTDQTEQTVATDTASETAATETGSKVENFFKSLLLDIIFLIVLLGPITMILHMVYVNWSTIRLKKKFTTEHFAAKRTKKGLSETMTDDEIDRGHQLFDEAFNELTVLETNEEGKEVRKPGRMKELFRAQKKINEVGKMMPTDEKLLEAYNDYRLFLYDYMRRSFFASWKLIILCIVVAIGASYLLKSDSESFWKSFFTIGAFFWIPSIVYYVSSQVPQYMIDRKNERGGGKGWFSTALVALGIGVLGSGHTVRTKWSDGSVTEDNSSHWVALVFGIFILVVVAATIYIWAILNYLRNYVFYW